MSQLFHLHEAPVGFKSLGDGRSASYPKNEDSVFCQHIVVPVSCRERSNRKKKMSSCHCQFGPVVVRRSLGHGSIGRISPQMGLQACMKKRKKRGGWMFKQAREQKYLNADRREIILSSLVVGRRGGGGDS